MNNDQLTQLAILMDIEDNIDGLTGARKVTLETLIQDAITLIAGGVASLEQILAAIGAIVV